MMVSLQRMLPLPITLRGCFTMYRTINLASATGILSATVSTGSYKLTDQRFYAPIGSMGYSVTATYSGSLTSVTSSLTRLLRSGTIGHFKSNCPKFSGWAVAGVNLDVQWHGIGSCPLLVKRGSLQIFWRFWVCREEGQPTPLL